MTPLGWLSRKHTYRQTDERTYVHTYPIRVSLVRHVLGQRSQRVHCTIWSEPSLYAYRTIGYRDTCLYWWITKALIKLYRIASWCGESYHIYSKCSDEHTWANSVKGGVWFGSTACQSSNFRLINSNFRTGIVGSLNGLNDPKENKIICPMIIYGVTFYGRHTALNSSSNEEDCLPVYSLDATCSRTLHVLGRVWTNTLTRCGILFNLFLYWECHKSVCSYVYIGRPGTSFIIGKKRYTLLRPR